MIDSLRFVAAMLVSRTAGRKSEEGATATEYGLLVGVIALALIVGATAFGDQMNLFFDGLKTRVSNW